MDFSKELYEAKKAAIIAGKKVMEIYRTDFKIDYKEDESPVTQADLMANEIIISHLKQAFPTYAFLSEESADDVSRLDNDLCFIIDPIDGTKEFVNKTGEFTINIALAYKQEIVMGVIYAPVLEELFYAEIGKGAFKVKERECTQLFVSDRKDHLRVAESRSHKSEKVQRLYDENKDIIEKYYEVGSTLKGCFLASAKLEAFYKFGLGTKEWDIAAMDIVITEAGGIFRDLNHNKYQYNKKDVYNKYGYYAINKEENLFEFDYLK
ncbi:3'(2'),5'-bisphosphate nucleotidase CysQ [Mycoplasmatota bacterium]|nr:3'(2'),5'-bisphosphate nucleotidase CysQ [Mycoplasmatota bacterium]